LGSGALRITQLDVQNQSSMQKRTKKKKEKNHARVSRKITIVFLSISRLGFDFDLGWLCENRSI